MPFFIANDQKKIKRGLERLQRRFFRDLKSG
jgi:hypothetical protein